MSLNTGLYCCEPACLENAFDITEPRIGRLLQEYSMFRPGLVYFWISQTYTFLHMDLWILCYDNNIFRIRSTFCNWGQVLKFYKVYGLLFQAVVGDFIFSWIKIHWTFGSAGIIYYMHNRHTAPRVQRSALAGYAVGKGIKRYRQRYHVISLFPNTQLSMGHQITDTFGT